MINITNIEDALYDWVKGVLPAIEVIHAKPNADRPTTPYASIKIFTNTTVGWSDSEKVLNVDKTTTITKSNLQQIGVSINLFYENAYYNACLLRDSLERVSVCEDLYAEGLGFLRTGDVQEIDAEIEKQLEERAQFDSFFSCRSTDVETLQTINKVGVNTLDGQYKVIEPN